MTAKRPFDKQETALLTAVALVLLAVMFFCGCTQEAEMVLKPSPGQVSTYKVVDLYRKDYLFEQVRDDKQTVKNTELDTEVVFDQVISNIDEDGNITADITIKSLKYVNSDSEGMNVDYDSSRDTDSRSALARLIGRHYTIKLSPMMKVLEISNIQPARNMVMNGRESNLAMGFLSTENIHKRHEIHSMPDRDKKKLKVGDTWSRVVRSPSGVLIPKNYEKFYTVEKVTDSGLALIKMNATPTSKKLEAQTNETEALDMFRNFFDSEDDYTGRLLIDAETGTVYEYNESLKSKYTAAEFPRGKPEPKMPDVLKLGFTDMHTVTLMD